MAGKDKIKCSYCGGYNLPEGTIACRECREIFCDNCYDVEKGDGCKCHHHVSAAKAKNPIDELMERHRVEYNGNGRGMISPDAIAVLIARAMSEIMTQGQWEVLMLRDDMRELFKNNPHLLEKRVVLQQPFWLSQ